MKESLSDKAQSVQSALETIRVLVESVDSKVSFFVTEKSLFGAYADVVNSFASDIQTLIGALGVYIWETTRDQDAVVSGILEELDGE